MDMNWRPVVRSLTEVEIPVIVLTHSAKAHQRWKDAQIPWQQSGYTDHSAFGRYATLVNSKRFRFPKGGQAAYKFAEFYTALRLEKLGYTCWSAVQLFDHRNPQQGIWQRNTNEVHERFAKTGIRWPSDIQHTLAFLPKTPDIVAHHRRKGWLFCEVKRPNDRIKPDQAKALGVLHLLTGAPVAIVRVVPRGDRTVWKPCVPETAGRRDNRTPVPGRAVQLVAFAIRLAQRHPYAWVVCDGASRF